MNVDGIIACPHLGASTPEAEDNCAVMVATELKDYFENGNIKNSVNYPAVFAARKTTGLPSLRKITLRSCRSSPTLRIKTMEK